MTPCKRNPFLLLVLFASFFLATPAQAETRDIRLVGSHFFDPSKVYLYQENRLQECARNNTGNCRAVSELELEFIKPSGCRDDTVSIILEGETNGKWENVNEGVMNVRSYTPEEHIKIPFVEKGEKNEANWNTYLFPESSQTLLNSDHFRVGVSCETINTGTSNGGALTIVSPGSNTADFFMRLDGIDAKKELQASVTCLKNDYAVGVKVAFQPTDQQLILALLDPVTRLVLSDSGIITGETGEFTFPDLAQRYIENKDHLDLIVFQNSDLAGGDIEKLLARNERYTRIEIRLDQCQDVSPRPPENQNKNKETPPNENQNSSVSHDTMNENLNQNSSSEQCTATSESLDPELPYQGTRCNNGPAPVFCFNFSQLHPGMGGSRENLDTLLQVLKNPAGWGAWSYGPRCQPGTYTSDVQPFWLEPRKSIFYDQTEQDTFAVSCKTECGLKELIIHAISPSSPLIYIRSKNLETHQIRLSGNPHTTLHFTDPFLPSHSPQEAVWSVVSGLSGSLFAVTSEAHDLSPNRIVESLFYEFKPDMRHPFTPPEQGYVVRYNEIESFLQHTLLEKIGLSKAQKEDYINDMLPRLGKNNFYFIGLVDENEWNRTVGLEVVPPVEKVQRIMLYFQARSEFSNVSEPDLQHFFFNPDQYDSSLLELGGYVEKGDPGK